MEGKKPRIGSAVVVEHNGKILLGERNKKNAKGFWIIPGGGVKYGESIRDAAVREIKEETNLDIEIIKPLGHKEIIFPEDNYHTIVFYHLAKPKNPEFELKPSDDVSDIGFFSIEEIKKMKILDSVEWALKKAGYW